MSTAALGEYFVRLLSITLAGVAIFPVLYGSIFIKTFRRKYMILYSLNANRDFKNFYNKIEYPQNSVYFAVVSIFVISILLYALLFVTTPEAEVYEIMVNTNVLLFTVLSILSSVLYFKIKKYEKSSTTETLEKKVVKFKKVWQRVVFIWVIGVTSYVIPALNIEGYYGFFLNYGIQNFIWIYIPLLFAFITIFFFINAGFLSTNLTWDLINKKLAEKSLLPEIDAYVRGLDGKLESIHGFVVNLGRYVKLETAKTVETLKYADIQRISSPKEINDQKCE